MTKRYITPEHVITADGAVMTRAQADLAKLELALEQDFDKLKDIVPEEGIEYVRSHLESGPGGQIDCWCDMGRDHTMAEWIVWVDREVTQ